MTWNWQEPHWPDFTFDPDALASQETTFLRRSGELIGAFRHIRGEDQDALRIELISDEAIKTSEIEGELLNRDSVQSSLRYQFGLESKRPNATRAERGISEMMVDLYRSFAAPLTERVLFDWHRKLMRGNRSIDAVGTYRTHTEAMQVASGPDYKRAIHFEAPPSARVPEEMRRFIVWFNDTAPRGKRSIPALTRAGIAHLYFVCVHPFEDGNGRIGRALAEKSLAQNLDQPSLIALAYTIERKRNDYYAALERNNKNLEITGWLKYFADTILKAQDHTIGRAEFCIAKAKFYEKFRGTLNVRQEQVVARLFRSGLDGFRGGLSAENYISIAKTSRATATRDLQDLVAKKALTRTGELRHTRYYLNLSGLD